MQYKLRTRSTVGRTNRTVYADGDAILAGGIEWTVADASNAILVGMTSDQASVELAGWGRVVRITIDGVDVGTFDRSGEVDQPRLATFLDAVFRDLEADWRARASAVEADLGKRSAVRRDALLAAFAATDLGPAPKAGRCHPSELLLRQRRQRREAGAAETTLAPWGISVRVPGAPGATVSVSEHEAKGDTGDVPSTGARLLVRLAADGTGDWPRWQTWESPSEARRQASTTRPPRIASRCVERRSS